MTDIIWLLAASIIVWLGLGGYLAWQHGRLAAMERKLEILERTATREPHA